MNRHTRTPCPAGLGSPPTALLRHPETGAAAVVRLRLLERDDTERMAGLLDRLSPTARYRRFFSPLPRITGRLVAAMTDVDHDRREAVAAVVGDDMIGLAEYVRSAHRPDAAEVAVVVEDRWQRRGLARLLTSELARIGRGRGVERFTAAVLAENRPVLAMVRNLSPGAALEPAGTDVEVVIPLRRPTQLPVESPAASLPPLAAAGQA
jgi:GNAT superfamily N-acetyltransferase